jgi:putative membrane protein
MGAGGWILMALFWIALLALVVFALVRLLPAGGAAHTPAHGSVDEPRAILDRRLASGEIDIDDYERLTRTLNPQGAAERG